MATGKVEDIFEKNFMTAAKFSVEIENIVKEGDLNYIEAIVQFCDCLLYTSPSPRDCT